jgi:group I intron endonuclease
MSDPLPTTSGIYKITCTANKRIYIGSAANLRQRKNLHAHELRQNKHGNRHLQRAWNKYGEQAFTFEVLELVLPISLTAREQYWINKLKPFGRKGFNILTEAGSNLGRKFSPEVREKNRQARLGRKRSPESIEKSRQAHLGSKRSPEARENMRAWQRGRKQSPEHAEKSRQAALGKKYPPMSSEHREELRQAKLGKPSYKRTPEHIERMRQATRGKVYTPERIERMRQARWGKNKEMQA